MAIDKATFVKILDSWGAKQATVILKVAQQSGISPFLIAALGYRESGWGKFLDANMTGDSGHGRGYVQIDDRSHGTWLANNDWKNGLTNVSFGIYLLKQNIAFLSSNSVVPGLTDGRVVSVHRAAAAERGVVPGTYKDPRPLIDQSDLLAAAVASYNTGIGNVLMSLAVGVSIDITTANHNYSTDVIAKSNSLLAEYNELAQK